MLNYFAFAIRRRPVDSFNSQRASKLTGSGNQPSAPDNSGSRSGFNKKANSRLGTGRNPGRSPYSKTNLNNPGRVPRSPNKLRKHASRSNLGNSRGHKGQAFPQFQVRSRSKRNPGSMSNRTDRSKKRNPQSFRTSGQLGPGTPSSASRVKKHFRAGPPAQNQYGQKYGRAHAAHKRRNEFSSVDARKLNSGLSRRAGPRTQMASQVLASYPLSSIEKKRTKLAKEFDSIESRLKFQKLKKKWISPYKQAKSIKKEVAKGSRAWGAGPARSKRSWTSYDSRSKFSKNRPKAKYPKKQISVPQKKFSRVGVGSKKASSKGPRSWKRTGGQSANRQKFGNRLKEAQRKMGKSGGNRRQAQAKSRLQKMRTGARKYGRPKAATTSIQKKSYRTGLTSRVGSSRRKGVSGLERKAGARQLKKTGSTLGRKVGAKRAGKVGEYTSMRKAAAKKSRVERNKARRPVSEYQMKQTRAGRSTQKAKPASKRYTFKSQNTREKQMRREKRLKEEMRKLNEQNRIRRLRGAGGAQKAKTRTTPISKLKHFRESLHKQKPKQPNWQDARRGKRLFSNTKSRREESSRSGSKKARVISFGLSTEIKKKRNQMYQANRVELMKKKKTDHELKLALEHVEGNLQGIDSIRRSGLREKTTRSLSKRLKRFFNKRYAEHGTRGSIEISQEFFGNEPKQDEQKQEPIRLEPKHEEPIVEIQVIQRREEARAEREREQMQPTEQVKATGPETRGERRTLKAAENCENQTIESNIIKSLIDKRARPRRRLRRRAT